MAQIICIQLKPETTTKEGNDNEPIHPTKFEGVKEVKETKAGFLSSCPKVSMYIVDETKQRQKMMAEHKKAKTFAKLQITMDEENADTLDSEPGPSGDGGAKRKPRVHSGGKYCAAVGCHHCTRRDGPRGIYFYKFPANPERRQRWLARVRRLNWQPNSSSRLCSAHFVNRKKSDDPRVEIIFH